MKTLLEAKKQEPVEHCLWARNGNAPCPHVQPKREWQGLTVEEIAKAVYKTRGIFGAARAIEAKLKEKNA